MTRHKYERHGLLALDPRAFLDMFSAPPPRPVNTVRDDVEIVSVSGPLDHHAGDWCDSYDSILDRVETALSGKAKTVVMKIDSPGGLVSGCFETARAIRAKAKVSGKKLVCYVDGQACSAAYALASAADQIVASETSVIGSIGVIDTRVDATAMDAAMGLKFAFVTSGSRKADGNPHQGISTSELIDKQGIVDSLAGVFFALVADMRGIDPASLEARVFVGADAKAKGLVDEILPFGDLLASLASAATTGAVMSKYAEARAALEEAAKGDDEEAKKAQRALAAMDGEDEEDDEEASASASAEGEDEEEKEKKDEEAKAVAASASRAASAPSASRLDAIENELRASFLATRPDLTDEVKRGLDDLPIERVRAIVAGIPKPRVPKAAAAATVQATRGVGQANADAAQVDSDPELAEVDRKMNIGAQPTLKAERRGNTVYLGRAPVEKA